MYLQQRPDENLDPRRRARHVRTRDWASRSAMVGTTTLPQLLQRELARLLVRLGLVR